MSLWRRAWTLDELNTSYPETLIKHLGIVFTEIGDDFISGTLPVDSRTRQPAGLLHGGASVVLAETLGSVAGNMCLPSEDFLCVGQEINANHVRSALDGRVTGTARPLHVGRRSHVWAIEIVNDARDLVCISRLTLAVVPQGPQGGRSR